MRHCYGFILDAENEQARAFAHKPMLGRSSRQFVRNGMFKAGLQIINDLENPREALVMLMREQEEFTLTFTREDAPGLSPETHSRLALMSQLQPEQPVAVLADDMIRYLAVSLPGSLLRSMALEKRPGHIRMSDIRRLFDDMGVPVKVLHGLKDNCYSVVDGPVGYAAAYAFHRRYTLNRRIAAGVIALSPDCTTVEYEATVGSGTTLYSDVLIMGRTQVGTGCTIYSGNVLQGSTVLGDDCVLYPASRLCNAQVGDRVTMEKCVLTDCCVGDDCQLGPFAVLGPGTVLGRGCRVDSFVTLQNVTVPDGTHVTGSSIGSVKK